MDKIILADGREFECISFAISSGGYLFIRVDMTLGEAATEFSHGTESVTYDQYGGKTITVRGFTKLEYIVNEDDCVRVALTRPVDIEEIPEAE